MKQQTIHCVKSVRIRNYSGPHFPVFGLNAERYGKIQTRITSNTDTFHAVTILCSVWQSLQKSLKKCIHAIGTHEEGSFCVR